MTPLFSVSQSEITPQSFTVTDESTDIPGTVTQRRLYVQNAYGVYLSGDGTVDYDEWPLANASITKSYLVEDTAANIKTDWLDINDDVVETLNINYPLSEFGKQFFFQLVSAQGLTLGIYQDSNYSGNLAIFWSNIVAGDNAVTYGNSLAAAQNCYNREIQMMQEQAKYF